uniref:Tim10-like domain-containing protein n=1 Tax=Ascaris lumbricoides TaxID=6252 RepID=A0A0M3HGN4_ASCLU
MNSLPDTPQIKLDLVERVDRKRLVTIFENWPNQLNNVLFFYMRNTVEAISELSNWCASGDCNIFTDYPSIYNRTTSAYISQVLLAQVVTNDDNVSLVIVSVVRGEFSVPRLLSAKCTHECRRQFWANGEYCRMKCAEKYVNSFIRHDWQNFLRIAAVENIRKKYAAFIEPQFQQ